MRVKIPLPVLLLTIAYASGISAAGTDSITIHSIGHASLCFEYNNVVIHVDPYSTQTDYGAQPDADLILITHGHSDHYDRAALTEVQKSSTIMVCPPAVKNLGTYTGSMTVLENGDETALLGVPIKAVPAYNISNNNHPQGVGNGYVITLGEKRIYIAGDTELIPAMDSLGIIDIAFLPMNLPYTMSVSMAAEAAIKIHPEIVYIYHFSNSDTAAVRTLLSGEDMEVRIGPSDFRESAGSTVAAGRGEQGGRHPAAAQTCGPAGGMSRYGAVGLRRAPVDLSGRAGAGSMPLQKEMMMPSTGSGVMVVRPENGGARHVVRVR